MSNKKEDFTLFFYTTKSVCFSSFFFTFSFFLNIDGRQMILKLGFYYRSSNTSLNVVIKWSKNDSRISRTKAIMLWGEVKDFHFGWNRANFVFPLFIKQWFKFSFIFNFPLCHCKESDQTEDKLALHTQFLLSDTPLVFFTSHSFNPPLRTILEGR